MSIAPARPANSGLDQASSARLISRELEIVACIPGFVPVLAAKWPDNSENSDSVLLCRSEAMDSPLDDTHTFLIDAISRGLSPKVVSREADFDVDILPSVYEDIGYILGVRTVSQMVDISASRGYIPIAINTDRLPRLLDCQRQILNGVRNGMNSATIMRQIGGITVTTYRDLRLGAFRAVGAQTNPSVVRQMHACRLAR